METQGTPVAVPKPHRDAKGYGRREPGVRVLALHFGSLDRGPFHSSQILVEVSMNDLCLELWLLFLISGRARQGVSVSSPLPLVIVWDWTALLTREPS